MAKRTIVFASICFFVAVAAHPAIAHPGAAIVVDAKGQVYFVDTGHGVWTVDAAGKLVDLGAPAFHWMTLDPDGRFAGLRVQGGSFEFVAKAIDGGVLILSSDFPVAHGNDFVYFAPYAKTPPLRILRLTRDGRTEPAAVIETRAQWLNGLAHSRDAFYFTEDAAVKKLMSDGSVSVIADNVMPTECSPDRVPETTVPYLRGLAVSGDGNVYVAATGCRVVVRIDRRGTVTTVLRAESPWAPTAVALHGNAVYVLEYLHTPGDDRRQWVPRVRKVDAGGHVSTIAIVNRPTR
jgi:DNA-binding beta-propeller fold protein YncE